MDSVVGVTNFQMVQGVVGGSVAMAEAVGGIVGVIVGVSGRVGGVVGE